MFLFGKLFEIKLNVLRIINNGIEEKQVRAQ